MHCEDLEGDGYKEIIFGARNYTGTPGTGGINVYIYSADTYVLQWKSSLSYYHSYIDIAVVDADGMGGMEVVVVTSYMSSFINKGHIYIYNGTTYEEVGNFTDLSKNIWLHLVCDLDGDGTQEFVVTSGEYIGSNGIGGRMYVHVYDGASNTIEWSSEAYTTPIGTGLGLQLTHADLEGDAIEELFIATYFVENGNYSGYLDIFDGSTYVQEYDSPELGGIILGMTQYSAQSFTVCDVDGDSDLEFLFLVADYVNYTSESIRFYSLDGNSKTVEHVSEELPFNSSYSYHVVYPAITVRDVDDDSKLEIFIILQSYPCWVRAFNGADYSPKWVTSTDEYHIGLYSWFGDLDGDGVEELMLLSYPNSIFASPTSVFDPTDGSLEWSSDSFRSHPYFGLIEDFDGDGRIEMLGYIRTERPGGGWILHLGIIEFQRPVAPILKTPIEDISIPEDTTDSSINLSQVFHFLYQLDNGFSCETNGTVSVEIAPNGTVTLAPPQDWFGVEYIEFSAKCGDENRMEGFNLTVTPVNDLPVISPLENMTVRQDESLLITAEGNDDIDMGTVEYADNTSLFDIDPLYGLGWTTPVNRQVGTHPVSIWVTDVNDTSAWTNFSLTVENVNDAPEILEIDGWEATAYEKNDPGSRTNPVLVNAMEDEWCNFTVTAFDIDQAELGLKENLTIALFPERVNASISIDNRTGSTSFLPGQYDVDPGGSILTVKVTVTDSGGLSDKAYFDIRIEPVNDPPSPPGFTWDITDGYPQTPEVENLTVLFKGFPSSDPDGDRLVYYWEFGDGTNQVDDGSLLFWHTFPEEGAYNVTLTAMDEKGEAAGYTDLVPVLEYVPPQPTDAGDVPADESADVVVEDDDKSSSGSLNIVILLIVVVLTCLLMFWLVVRRRRRTTEEGPEEGEGEGPGEGEGVEVDATGLETPQDTGDAPVGSTGMHPPAWPSSIPLPVAQPVARHPPPPPAPQYPPPPAPRYPLAHPASQYSSATQHPFATPIPQPTPVATIPQPTPVAVPADAVPTQLQSWPTPGPHGVR